MTKKRKRPHSHNVKPIPSTQLNVKQIERQISRGNERTLTASTWNETNARRTIAKSSEAPCKLRRGFSSDSQTGTFSNQSGYFSGNIPNREETNGRSETWRQVTTPSDTVTHPLASKQCRLQSTSCIFDTNVNAWRSERTVCRDSKGKFVQNKVGRPPKTCSNEQVIKLPVIPVLKISLTDVKALNDDRACRKGSPSRYRVTPYPFGQKCIISQPPRQSHRCRRTSRCRSESSCKCSSPDRRGRSRHRCRHRSKASITISCRCRCSCSRCQTCKQKSLQRSRSNSTKCRRSRSNSKDHKRRKRGSPKNCSCSSSNSKERKRRKPGSPKNCSCSCSNSKERKRRKPGSPDMCRRSRSHSDPGKGELQSPKATPKEKTSRSPDATKTVKTILERVSNAFSGKKKGKDSSTNNDLEQQRKHESRKSRSRSPQRRHHRKRPPSQETTDSTMMCLLM